MFFVQSWNIVFSLYFYISLVSSFEVNDISVPIQRLNLESPFQRVSSVWHVLVFVLFLTGEPFQYVFSYRSK